MSEEAIKQTYRKIKNKTQSDLDGSSFRVWEATGKAARDWDFLCSDNIGYRYVKVFYQFIPKDCYFKLLGYDENPEISIPITQIQFYVWDKYGQKPIANPKLRFNKPEQGIHPALINLVK